VTCPKCKTDHAHRSHRQRWKDYVASLFEYYPYRCTECRHRFFVLRREPPGTAEKPTATETEIRVTRSKLKWRRKRRELLLYGWALLAFLVFLYFVTRDRGGSSAGD